MSTIDRPVTDGRRTGENEGGPAATGAGAAEVPPGIEVEAVRTMPQFREAIAQAPFSMADREVLVQQAAAMLDGIYVHLAQKRAMYAIDPGQKLRLLRRKLTQLSDAEFHAQLSRIFVELRDLHTLYVLPRPYRGPVAALGVMVERFVGGGRERFMVSKASAALTGDPNLVPGSEALHWNGAPMALAVARNAEREAGSNAAARSARGLESLAFRVLALSPTPDEDWVDLHYRPPGAAEGDVREVRIPWRVFDGMAELRQASGGMFGEAGTIAASDDATNGAVPVPPAHMVGVDLRTDVVQRVKKALFAPGVAVEQRRVDAVAAAGDALEPTEAQAAAGEIPTTRPNELSARTVTTPHGTFGHLRIFTFHMEGADAGAAIDAFRQEVMRLLALLPRDGLILDVRNNGGGYVYAGESLLQFFCPRTIAPEPTQFINTPLTAELCRKVPSLGAWADSIEASIETGAQYSGGVPLYPAEWVNDVGQLYHGPVVLVTDAFCYSTTDFFAAGSRTMASDRCSASTATPARAAPTCGPRPARVGLGGRPVQGPARRRHAAGGAAPLAAGGHGVGRPTGRGPGRDPRCPPRHDVPRPARRQRGPHGRGRRPPRRAHGPPPRRRSPAGRHARRAARRHARPDDRGPDRRRRLRGRSAGGNHRGDRRGQHAARAARPGAGRHGDDPARGLRRRGAGGLAHAHGHGQLTATARGAGESRGP